MNPWREPDRWHSLTGWPDHEAPYRNGPEPQQHNCAGCNAPLDVLRRANCEYCGRPH